MQCHVRSIPPQTIVANGENTCHYICAGGRWTLSVNNALPGYYCPNDMGPCDGTSDTLVIDALEEEESRQANATAPEEVII